ncbi:hypothetical protein VNO77_03374 [Canavalia gladiata]|uniref:Uncharacterized protein n=1 Tax=Canavalia gladiata TaxID=3824 RepID=A0AAN9R833_CANGL
MQVWLWLMVGSSLTCMALMTQRAPFFLFVSAWVMGCKCYKNEVFSRILARLASQSGVAFNSLVHPSGPGSLEIRGSRAWGKALTLHGSGASHLAVVICGMQGDRDGCMGAHGLLLVLLVTSMGGAAIGVGHHLARLSNCLRLALGSLGMGSERGIINLSPSGGIRIAELGRPPFVHLSDGIL